MKTKFADTPEGRLPLGFLALDLAQALGLPLLDPDDGYAAVPQGQHSKFGNGLLGGDKANPKMVVAANAQVGVATADFPAQPIGFRTPSIFLTAQQSVTSPDQLISIVTPKENAAAPYADAAASLGQVVSAFLASHPEFRLDAFPHPLEEAPPAAMIQLWPQVHDGDARFIARMVRSPESKRAD